MYSREWNQPDIQIQDYQIGTVVPRSRFESVGINRMENVMADTEKEKITKEKASTGNPGKGNPREKRPMEKSVLIVFLVILLILAAAAAGGIYCIWQITHIAREGAGVILLPGAFGR